MSAPTTLGDHDSYMRQALSQARRSPPRPTNYRVGALVVDPSTGAVLATGYTLELEGNTHAEQCCFEKLARRHGLATVDDNEAALADALPAGLALYTTVEPCSQRLSGNLPCLERVLRLRRAIAAVYVGVAEPYTFVSNNTARKRLEEAGIAYVHVAGLEDEVLETATAGHAKT